MLRAIGACACRSRSSAADSANKSIMYSHALFRRLIGALAFFCATPIIQASGDTTAPTGEWRYEIIRGDRNIGSHSIQFSQSGTHLDVHIETSVTVKLGFVVVYRYSHLGHETWKDGQLVALETTTDDDGNPHRVIAARDGDALKVESDGASARVSDGILPDSLWNQQFIDRDEVLDSDNGHIARAHAEFLGTETLIARGETISARHYRIVGDLQCEVWYDTVGTLVHIRFIGSDGSNIDYVLQ